MEKQKQIDALFDDDHDEALAYMLGTVIGAFGIHLSKILEYGMAHKKPNESHDVSMYRAIKWAKNKSYAEMVNSS